MNAKRGHIGHSAEDSASREALQSTGAARQIGHLLEPASALADRRKYLMLQTHAFPPGALQLGLLAQELTTTT
jgi:hypothetical protein